MFLLNYSYLLPSKPSFPELQTPRSTDFSRLRTLVNVILSLSVVKADAGADGQITTTVLLRLIIKLSSEHTTTP